MRGVGHGASGTTGQEDDAPRHETAVEAAHATDLVPAAAMTDLAAPIAIKRSGTELALIGFGLVLTMLAFTSVSAAYSSKFPSGLASDGLGFIALAGVAHLAVRRLAPYADPVL